MKKSSFSNKDIEKIVLLYNDGYSVPQISKLIGRANSTIYENLRKVDAFSFRDASQTSRKYKIFEDFFDEINSEEKAYFLGFLYADGNINDNGSICLSQAEQDSEIVYKFAKCIGKDLYVGIYQDKRKNRQPNYVVSVRSIHMMNTLISHGCSPRKTFILKFPLIKDHSLMIHFIRGYFDGDGCISLNKRNRKGRGQNNKNIIVSTRLGYDFSICSTIEFLLSIKNIIEKELNIYCRITKRHKDRNNNNFTLIISGRSQIEKVMAWFYKDATIFLSRKYNKFLKLSNQIPSEGIIGNTGEYKMRNVITPKPDIVITNIADTDSYKYSHFLQYPKGMTSMMSYLESRGGEWDECTLFGLQVLLHKYLSKKFTLADLDKEEQDALAHGEPFNKEGWLYILTQYNGYIPGTIRAIPEGLVVPVKNATMTIELTDEKCFWVVNWLETKLSRVWGSSEIAILSREIKKVWMHYLTLSSDNPEAEIGFKHHDFGSRGVTCLEQAGLHGAAHLLNFFGSDTMAGIKYANYYYDCPMSGFSIPATEHSTMTVWGPDHEYDAVKNWITKTLVERQVPEGLPKLSACVGDSYNIYNFVKMICTTDLKDLIKSSGGTLVIRPDSGDPIIVLGGIFDILEQYLKDEITVNSKGYKVLPSWIRVIQGDGINRHSMKEILHHVVVVKGWSATNIAMGSGGGLLQDVNRDTQKYAFKCCHAVIDGKSVDVRKDPVTDSGKKSKAGRLDLIKTANGYETVVLKDGEVSHPDSVMNAVYENGDILYHNTLDECRVRMAL